MSTSEASHDDKFIEELRLLIKKVFVEPEIIKTSIEITRELIDEDDATQQIAQRISDATNIKIPFNPSAADALFIDILKEVVKDEKALY